MRRIVKEPSIRLRSGTWKIMWSGDTAFRLYRVPGVTAAVRFKAPGRKGGSMPSEPQYSKIRVPTLLLVGEKDNLRDHGTYGEALQAKVPGANLHVVREAGHFVQIDLPEEFLAVVNDFLKT